MKSLEISLNLLSIANLLFCYEKLNLLTSDLSSSIDAKIKSAASIFVICLLAENFCLASVAICFQQMLTVLVHEAN